MNVIHYRFTSDETRKLAERTVEYAVRYAASNKSTWRDLHQRYEMMFLREHLLTMTDPVIIARMHRTMAQRATQGVQDD